ncbi:hypothetical protein [Jannaschia seohaensis]|uniref:Lipoprotein n=1 Tax=Jannaschia seohaensis TaxID=475081 RepID=A0A2Y9C3T2_9RHOB|nr:hypothetical protein [Jannaschia seohaensis]PWJ22075.1 hypothetical protein BCF38_101484 [Jannaschia seohaensis]SSA38353.1 hypothetical protein SAMN05421539_101484 [Jannaschia seohaensis]
MIRALLMLAALSACGAQGPGLSAAMEEIAVQRMRFTLEAVCVNNRTRRAQARVAETMSFPERQRDNGTVFYLNPGTLTVLALSTDAPLTLITEDGHRLSYRRDACAVGSPVVGVQAANRIMGEILAPRLVDGSNLAVSGVAFGQNRLGGTAFYFEDLAVIQDVVDVSVFDPETGATEIFSHPVVLVLHR